MSEQVRIASFVQTGDIMLTRHHLPLINAFNKAWDAAFGQDPLGVFVSRYPLTVDVHKGFYPAHGGLVVMSNKHSSVSGLSWDEVVEYAGSKQHLHITQAKFEKQGMLVSSGPKDLATLFGKVDPGAGVQAWALPETVEVDPDTGLYTYESSQGRRDMIFLRFFLQVSNLDWPPHLIAEYEQDVRNVAYKALSFLGLGYDVPQMAGVVTLALAGRLDKENPFDPPHLMNCTEVPVEAYTQVGYEFYVRHPQIAGRSLVWWMVTPNWVKRGLMKFIKPKPVHPSNLTWIAGLLESPVLREVRHTE